MNVKSMKIKFKPFLQLVDSLGIPVLVEYCKCNDVTERYLGQQLFLAAKKGGKILNAKQFKFKDAADNIYVCNIGTNDKQIWSLVSKNEILEVIEE